MVRVQTQISRSGHQKVIRGEGRSGNSLTIILLTNSNYCQLLFRLDIQHLQSQLFPNYNPYCKGLSVNFACISRTNCLKIGLIIINSNPESHLTDTQRKRLLCANSKLSKCFFFCTFKGSEQKNLFRLGGGSPHSFLSKRGNFLFEGHWVSDTRKLRNKWFIKKKFRKFF